MFGYVRPTLDRLTDQENQNYRALYCGLCHTLGRRYGPVSRWILNYDFTFLAALLSGTIETEERRCIASPFRTRTAALETPALDLAADCSVILTGYKIRDEIQDSAFLRAQGCRAAGLLLGGAFQKACGMHPRFAESTRREMARLLALEQQRCDTLDEPADTFACLLAGIAEEVEDPIQRRVLSQFLYHLGRWIYLVDALDDLEKDAREGQYNPILLRYGLTGGKLSGEDRRSVVVTLDASIRQMAAAFELWDFGSWSGVIRATVYDGFYRVGNGVLEGTFHASHGKKRSGGGKKEHI